jgi:hypothetical protein
MSGWIARWLNAPEFGEAFGRRADDFMRSTTPVDAEGLIECAVLPLRDVSFSQDGSSRSSWRTLPPWGD